MEEGRTQEKYGPEKGKSVAYAIAVQQAHKTGKSPKGFRTPKGVREAKKKYDRPKGDYRKTAEDMTKVNRIFGILKQASIPGQDLRKEFSGAPRFPTEDSKTRSNELFEQSRDVSEVGSVPKPKDLNKATKGPKIKDIVPNMHTTAGDLPVFGKEGSAMTTLENDPLIRYMAKMAMKAKKSGTSGMAGDAHVSEMDADGTEKFVRTLKELFDHPQGESNE
jgi:hypothetical protein